MLKLCFVAKIYESNQEFQEPTATQRATVARTGRHIGIMMWKYIFISLAPSILADSESEAGNEFIYVLMTITLNAPTKAGSIYTQNLLMRPRLRYRKYVGIRPALIYIVINMNIVVNLLRTKSLWLSAYASSPEKNTFSIVVRTVRATDIRNALNTLSVLNTL